MHYYHLDSGNFQPTIIEKIGERFLVGDVGILPTDTTYGLMCSYHNPKGQERIYEMKRRDKQKKLQVLIASIDDIAKLNVPLSEDFKSIAMTFWPGPLTLVVDDDSGKRIGLRIPNHPFLLSVLRKVNEPLAATSANISGGDPSTSLSCHFSDLTSSPDFIVMNRSNTARASTVVRLSENGAELIREGAIPIHSIEKVIKGLKKTV